MNEIVDFITSIGFPMAAASIIYIDSRKDKEKLYEALNKFGDKLDCFGKTLNNIDNRVESVEKQLNQTKDK